MIKVVGVRFRSAGKIYYFDPQKLDIKKGEHVIVETARGVEYGTVVLGIKEIADDEITAPLKPVIRIATVEDKKKDAKNRDKEKEAFGICLEKHRKSTAGCSISNVQVSGRTWRNCCKEDSNEDNR